MDRAKRKEKQRLKRKEKQRELRRIQSITPLRRICTGGGTLECWINSNWREIGMANLLVLGQAGSGQYALAALLIDIWCVGLKDAWGNADYSRLDFDQMLKCAKEGMPMVRIDTDAARRLVAGGIRFARQNGFRLPPDYDRWTAMLGGLGDIGAADLADFGKDGKLLYVGDRQFLAQRLNGMSVEQFMQRPDVDWTMGADSPFDEESEHPSIEGLLKFNAGLQAATQRGVAVVSEWCRQNNQEPHPNLEEAMLVFLGACGTTGEDETPVEELAQEITDKIGEIFASGLVQDAEAHVQAVQQILTAMQQMGPDMLKQLELSDVEQPANELPGQVPQS